MVEFALVVPLLLLILFGIMEAGWFFAQQVEVNNAAREGGRLAVVDYPGPDSGNSTDIINEVCSRSALSADRASVTLTKDPASGTSTDTATVTVSQTYASLTGFIPVFSGKTISSTVVMRSEREVLTWTPQSDVSCSP